VVPDPKSSRLTLRIAFMIERYLEKNRIGELSGSMRAATSPALSATCRM